MAVYTQIDNPELFFQCKIYTGTGTSTAFTLDGDEDMQPDLVWLKYRNASDSHALYDSVRGTQEILQSDRDSAEISQDNGLSAFGSDGFTIGDNGQINTSSGLYVAWCWKESTTAGFDIVLYTGNGSNRTIAHGLSAKPDMIIAKSRSNVLNWKVGHEGLAGAGAGWTNYMNLDETGGIGTASIIWQDTAPTSSVWSLGDSNLNTDTYTYVAYLFAPKQGFSKFGSYVGNGSSDGAFVYTGFRPAYVMIKDTTGSSEPWEVYDNKRLGYNESNSELYPSTTSAEQANTRILLFSNGFKANINSAGVNGSGNTYIYMAFAEAPFVNSNGVPCNAR